MKVIQIMPEFGLAGAEIMCENLTYELVKNGHEVIVVSLYDFHSVITARLEKEGIQVLYLNKRPGLDFSMIRKIYAILRKEKPDVIHTHRYVMQYAIPAAAFAGVKHRVHTIHNIAQKENTKIARKLNFLFYKFAHVIPVALSEEIQKTVVEEYHLKRENVPVIYNGINLSNCKKKTDYSIEKYTKILHIGRFSEQKNHEGLISAFLIHYKKYPNSKLLLIGDGEKRTLIEEKVNELGLNSVIEFLGLQDNVYGYLNTADIFILPSLYEGIPMTLIEAMGTGLPIIATAVGGIPDMLENGKEALIVDCDITKIAGALDVLCSNKEKRQILGENARKRSDAFSAKIMAKQYEKIYLR